ncbi:hypothetical protein EPA93_33865 [Ktedonosporobacter rubrisoli]|uniref:Uncharacterized protein n=1 Tax=Ktedonosporobacter rubrisoli TaxID=2509675 RepID=A0A4P6JYC1_KTERU|nr:hypothetical protein [Ktedonosporobacter rubrisoli]QBD80694.1 hypothetical protein EPA93_33865 [Ktedonosporobacter rubrisoli]
MENNSQSRTLYILQIFTIVVLILVLIMHILPFFNIGITPKQIPPGALPSGKSSGQVNPARAPLALQAGLDLHIDIAMQLITR